MLGDFSHFLSILSEPLNKATLLDNGDILISVCNETRDTIDKQGEGRQVLV